MVSPNVMVVSHTLDVQQAFASLLAKSDIVPIIASTGSEAKAILKHHSISLIFCSDDLPGSDVEDLIRQKSPEPNRVPTVVVSRLDQWDCFIRFLHMGALDYVLFPLSDVEIERVVKNALSLIELRKVRQAAAAN